MSNSLSPSDASSNWRSKANNDLSPLPSSFPGKKQRSTGNHHSHRQPAFHSSATFESRPLKQSKAKEGLLPAHKNEDYLESDANALQAIEEGRRLYVGNLPYMAKKQDVQALFEGDGYTVKRIDISIDPFTGRNLSYCFVDLGSREEANRAMADLNQGDFLGRPVKIGPGKARRPRPHPSPKIFPLVFEGWRESNASDHWEGYAAHGKRLYVGGLPTMASHRVLNENIRELFRGFQLEAVSKMISPPVHRPGPRNHFYVFVDFMNATEAGEAAKKLDGTLAFGGRIRVSRAKDNSNSRKVGERARWEEEQQRNNFPALEHDKNNPEYD